MPVKMTSRYIGELGGKVFEPYLARMRIANDIDIALELHENRLIAHAITFKVI